MHGLETPRLDRYPLGVARIDVIHEYSAMLKACGHPLRLRILCAIEKGEDTCVSELWTCLDVSQPVVSQHLAVLKRKGIVSSQVKGNRRMYSIKSPFVKSLVRRLLQVQGVSDA